MVYQYKRKTDQAKWTESNLKRAMDAVIAKKKTILSAAKNYQIPFSILQRHIKSGSYKKKLGRFTAVFTKEHENELCCYLKEMDTLFFGLTRTDFLELCL